MSWRSVLGIKKPERKVKIVFEYPDASEEPRFAKTQFVVEAASYEKHVLWSQHSHQGSLNSSIGKLPKFEWVQDHQGRMIKVGELGGRPVIVTFFWFTIDGVLVAFWEATSQVVDHKMIEEWLEANCAPRYDNGHRLAHCDAFNFSHCLSAIREFNKAKGNK